MDARLLVCKNCRIIISAVVDNEKPCPVCKGTDFEIPTVNFKKPD